VPNLNSRFMTFIVLRIIFLWYHCKDSYCWYVKASSCNELEWSLIVV
jgi:hypothetical protein